MRKPLTASTNRPEAHSFECEAKVCPEMNQCVFAATGVTMDVLGLPFDIARAQYARAVQLGLIERSMLASRDFSRVLGSLEKLTLGPWARHV
jgi:hypothetical protein